MRLKVIILFITIIAAGALSIEASKNIGKKEPGPKVTMLKFTVPKGWPKPVYDFTSNPITQQGFDLGKKLFYDGRLSKDGNFPCASCHQQFAAFSTFEHSFSHGFNNTLSTRNASGIFNVAWKKNFMWDGGITHLDLQPLAPITAANEMSETFQNIIIKLKKDVVYKKMFTAAFGDERINTQRITRALSQFLLMMVSSNSKYDKVMRGEDSFNLPQRLGYEIFKQKCVSCHAEPFFTDFSYRNNGLPPMPGIADAGRMRITGNKEDSLKFFVPSLRNTQLTSPYMHDGRFIYLDNVLNHYRNEVVVGPTTDSSLKNKIALSNFEIGQIKAFLYTLTDTAFIKDKRFSE
ncbi:MAG TPA: cytochrome c peroxidase [Segetibacter sp.]|jgi:cytochrome c peroxidase